MTAILYPPSFAPNLKFVAMKGKKVTATGSFAEIKPCVSETPVHVEPTVSGWKYIKLVYPNGVTLQLPYDIDSKDLARFINIECK